MRENAVDGDVGAADGEANQPPARDGEAFRTANRGRVPPAREVARAEAAMLQERNEVFRNMGVAMADIANRGQMNNARGLRSRHQIWADLLGLKVEDMPEANRGRFELHVDRLAFEAQQEGWVPPD